MKKVRFLCICVVVIILPVLVPHDLTVKQLNQALSGLYDIRMEILKMVN